MRWRAFSFVKGAVLSVTASLLLGLQLLAGESVRAAKSVITQPHLTPAPIPRVPQAVTIAIVVTFPAQPATPPLAVNLRGPNGQVRRFAVEGGRNVIRTRSVVLRPGESLTILWRPAK